MHASGTFFFGFSTAPEFCAADSSPRNAHSVSVTLEPIPPRRVSPFGFHAAVNVSAWNHAQPAVEMNPTGRITPHTVTAPIFPVTPAPPKFATVVSHSSTMTPTHVATGVDD